MSTTFYFLEFVSHMLSCMQNILEKHDDQLKINFSKLKLKLYL